jgi:hypothetical protein
MGRVYAYMNGRLRPPCLAGGTMGSLRVSTESRFEGENQARMISDVALHFRAVHPQM